MTVAFATVIFLFVRKCGTKWDDWNMGAGRQNSTIDKGGCGTKKRRERRVRVESEAGAWWSEGTAGEKKA